MFLFRSMPDPYWSKKAEFPLSRLNEHMQLVRVRCVFCKRVYNYRPDDLIQIFGDVDVDSLMLRMKCETGGQDHGILQVTSFSPTGRDAVGLRIRRLVALKIQRVPVWRED